MKKILSVLLSLMMVFSVAACSKDTQASPQNAPKLTVEQKLKQEKIPKANTSLTKQQVIQKAVEKSDKLKSVTATYQVKVVQLDNKNQETKNQNTVNIDTKIVYTPEKDEKGFKKISKMYDKTNIDGKESESYVDIKKNKIYLNDDGKGLKEYKKNDLVPQTDSNYDSVLKIFSLVAKNMKMTETDTTYNFTYKSDLSTKQSKDLNGEMVYKLDAPFGMGISLKHLDEVDANITFKISKKDFTMVSIEEQFKQTVDKQSYSSTGKFTLKSIDDLKEIPEAKNLK